MSQAAHIIETHELETRAATLSTQVVDEAVERMAEAIALRIERNRARGYSETALLADIAAFCDETANSFRFQLGRVRDEAWIADRARRNAMMS